MERCWNVAVQNVGEAEAAASGYSVCVSDND